MDERGEIIIMARINSTQATYIILSQEANFYNERLAAMMRERIENKGKYLMVDD